MKGRILKFAIGLISSLVTTVIITGLELQWGFPSGFFRKPIRIQITDPLNNLVTEDVKVSITAYPPMTTENGLIALNLANFPKNHQAILYIKDGQDEILLTDPLPLDLRDLRKPILVQVSTKTKILANVVDWGKICIKDIFLMTGDDTRDPIYPVTKEGVAFVFYVPTQAEDVTFSVVNPDTTRRME